MEPLRFGLVGCGRIAQSHLQALAAVPDAALTAVVEPRERVGRAVAEEARCPLFVDPLAPGVLDRVDAVIVCTPPSSHFEIARHFLAHGVHVLCEKPFTLDRADARELVERAATKAVHVMMASKFRHVDDVVRAKALIESGVLGDVVLYENAFCSKLAMAERWNSQPAVAGGGVLVDNGAHAVDIARYLLGPLSHVQAHTGLRVQHLAVEETVRLHFQTGRGALGTIDLSWSVNKGNETYITVHGTEGALEVGWKGSRYRRDGAPEWTPFGAGYDKLAAFRNQLENFVGVVRGTAAPLIRPEDAVASVELIAAAYETLDRNSWHLVGTT